MARRVHEIAKEHGLTAKELLARLHAAGVEVKAASSTVDEEVALSVLGNGQASTPTQPRAGAATAPGPAAAAVGTSAPAAAEPKPPPGSRPEQHRLPRKPMPPSLRHSQTGDQAGPITSVPPEILFRASAPPARPEDAGGSSSIPRPHAEPRAAGRHR